MKLVEKAAVLSRFYYKTAVGYDGLLYTDVYTLVTISTSHMACSSLVVVD